MSDFYSSNDVVTTSIVAPFSGNDHEITIKNVGQFPILMDNGPENDLASCYVSDGAYRLDPGDEIVLPAGSCSSTGNPNGRLNPIFRTIAGESTLAHFYYAGN